ncbi:MAG: DUF3368 domain-containing protein, partial [bacterium]|nr:DUF3368 domain-containing protein [bacterium]
MAEAITNTSPLIYLDRIRRLEWLPRLFDEVWVPTAVVDELHLGRQHGHRDLDLDQIPGFRVVDPETQPSEWLSSDLGPGELAAITLAMEHPGRVLILDDGRARRTAQAAGLDVWGTLRGLLGAKSNGLT